MALLYSATLFSSAFLLFSVQPMVGKFLLPLLGGSPQVWNTCMVFFQALLLFGYLYAHALARYVPARHQGRVHLLILALACACLLGAGQPNPAAAMRAGDSPVIWILGTLLRWVGLPVFLLAATSPLLQLWYARTGGKKPRDPYFLYGASNLGSLLALLSYPLVLEPAFTLSRQRTLWNAGYLALAAALAAIAATKHAVSHATKLPPARPIPKLRLARWVLLAFVPSSLLLGVTSYLSTDIAPVPLLWVLPLAIYLMTFIAAARGLTPSTVNKIARALALAALCAICALSTSFDFPEMLLVILHLTLFLLAATLCHGLLLNSRPPASQLTIFYLCVALGGVLGGIFNTLVAPLLFSTLAEYPLAIVLAVGLRPGRVQPSSLRARSLDLAYAGAVGLCFVLLQRLGANASWLPQHLHNVINLGLPALLCLRVSARHFRFALALASLYICSTLIATTGQDILARQRSFFGSLLVNLDLKTKTNLLFHGRTLHGAQSQLPASRREPLSYYSRLGPVADILAYAPHRSDVAVVGLGTGSMAAYARATESWTFYEINAQVIAIAKNPGFFTFLRDASAVADIQIELGDARLRLQQQADASLDVLIVDAFGSDSIPVHLITREAVELYWRKLRPDGLLAFHISNRFLELSRALGPLATATGAKAFHRVQRLDSTTNALAFVMPSHWLVMARTKATLNRFAADPRWPAVENSTSARVWSDDYFNLLALLRIW